MEASAARTALAPLERAQTVTEVVYNRIREAIVDRTFPPGVRVTEADVAQQLGVSKTPVREAFVRLREIGLIEAHGLRGSRVVGALPEAFRHAYEIREVVEGFTAQTAADRADESTAAEIKRAATDSFESASAGDIDGYLAADAVFHAAIAAAAGNPRAHKIIDDATSLIKALRARDLPHAHLAQIASECGQRHIRVADAIAAGDGRRAAEEMRSHLQYEERYLYAKSREGLSGAGGWLTES